MARLNLVSLSLCFLFSKGSKWCDIFASILVVKNTHTYSQTEMEGKKKKNVGSEKRVTNRNNKKAICELYRMIQMTRKYHPQYQRRCEKVSQTGIQ